MKIDFLMPFLFVFASSMSFADMQDCSKEQLPACNGNTVDRIRCVDDGAKTIIYLCKNEKWSIPALEKQSYSHYAKCIPEELKGTLFSCVTIETLEGNASPGGGKTTGRTFGCECQLKTSAALQTKAQNPASSRPSDSQR